MILSSYYLMSISNGNIMFLKKESGVHNKLQTALRCMRDPQSKTMYSNPACTHQKQKQE